MKKVFISLLVMGVVFWGMYVFIDAARTKQFNEARQAAYEYIRLSLQNDLSDNEIEALASSSRAIARHLPSETIKSFNNSSGYTFNLTVAELKEIFNITEKDLSSHINQHKNNETPKLPQIEQKNNFRV